MLKLSQPQGFYTLTFGELWERFSYYGTQTLLVLYLITEFSLTDDKSYSLYGAYAAFSYALPVFGGLLADRLLGLKHTLIIGGLLLIVGNLLMSIPHLNVFYAGLAFTVCGIGLYKPNSGSIVGKLYSIPHDNKMESGFTLFYIGMNIGATASPFVYGLIGKYEAYHYSYLFSAVVLFVSWVVFLTYKRHILLNDAIGDSKRSISISLHKKLLIYVFILAACGLVDLLFLYPILLNNFLVFSAAVILVTLILYAMKCQAVERNRIFALLILGFFGMCFFAASLQVGSSVNLFIQRNVNCEIESYQIPAIMFTSLYPLAVIFIAPVIASIWSYLASRRKEFSAPTRFVVGLFLGGLGFVFFTLAVISSGKNIASHLPIFWIVMGNLALGAGEVCLMPIMFSTIAQLAPDNLKSTMMGVWYLFVACGGYLSGVAAKLSNQAADKDVHNFLSRMIYQYAFLKMSVISLLIACVLLVLTPGIKSLMGISRH